MNHIKTTVNTHLSSSSHRTKKKEPCVTGEDFTGQIQGLGLTSPSHSQVSQVRREQPRADSFLPQVKGQLSPFILRSIHGIHSVPSHPTANTGFHIPESLACDHARWYIIFILHTANNRILQYQVAKFRGLYLNEICRSATSCSQQSSLTAAPKAPP